MHSRVERYLGLVQDQPLSSVERFWVDHQFDTPVRANAPRGRLAMPWSIAAQCHGEQLISWHAHRDQSIENGECLSGSQLVVRSGGGVKLSAVPVSFNANNLFGEVLPYRADDALQHG